jgi:methylglutaconyl-CoA hydratase
MFYLIRTCPLPVIARVNGDAEGGGLGILAACDISIGLQSAKFAVSDNMSGLSPAVTTPFLLRHMRLHDVHRFSITNEYFHSEKAREMGLLHETSKDVNDLDTSVDKVLNMLFKNSPNAMRECKDSLLRCDWLYNNHQEIRNLVCSAATKAILSMKDGSPQDLFAIVKKRAPVCARGNC